MSKAIDFSEAYERMKIQGMKVPEQKTSFKVPDAKNVFEDACRFFIGEEYQWLPEYKGIVDWLKDNNGRGLFLFGNCGRGKTVISNYVIPAIYLMHFHKVFKCYDMQELNKDIDNALKFKYVSIDDIGTEEESVKYGERRVSFAEMIDKAEKDGSILIMSTNLTNEQIKEKYGDRVIDRIKSVSKRVLFKGDSLRN